MDPGTVAAAYGAETAIEGAALGAYTVSKPTVPLHVRFSRLPSPSSTLLARSSHTLNVIKEKAYIFGGDVEGNGGEDGVGSSVGDNAVHVVTLPSDLSLMDMDYERIEPATTVTTVEGHPESSAPPEKHEAAAAAWSAFPTARAAHTAARIDSKLYIFGGRLHGSSSAVDEQGAVYVFDTIACTWATLYPHPTDCSQGVPCPRVYASSTSTRHPLPSEKGNDVTMSPIAGSLDHLQGGHGTLFLHGGYDSEGALLRDVWAFDVASRIWSRWPDVPDPPPGTDDLAGEGNICCVDSRLWRCGDGFGKVTYLDIVRDDFNDMGGIGELGVSPKTGNWETKTFGAMPGFESLQEKVEEKMGGKPSGPTAPQYPNMRKGAAFVPVTTGAGREYLLYMMGEEDNQKNPQQQQQDDKKLPPLLDDVWSFQLKSSKKSAALLKDSIRSMFGQDTGQESWARAEVIQFSKTDGPAADGRPRGGGLKRFGSSATGGDWGLGAAIVWGGIASAENGTTSTGVAQRDGWVMVIED